MLADFVGGTINTTQEVPNSCRPSGAWIICGDGDSINMPLLRSFGSPRYSTENSEEPESMTGNLVRFLSLLRPTFSCWFANVEIRQTSG